MSKKNKGSFATKKVIGTSVITDTLKIELYELTLSRLGRSVTYYQIWLNGEFYSSVDNRSLAFYLLNDFDFKEYLRARAEFLEG